MKTRKTRLAKVEPGARLEQSSKKSIAYRGIVRLSGIVAVCIFLTAYCFAYLFRNPLALITIPMLFFTLASLYAMAIIGGVGWSGKSGRDVWTALFFGTVLCLLTIFAAYWLSVLLWHQEPINPLMYFSH